MSKYNATYTSVWDDETEISSRCHVKKNGFISKMGKMMHVMVLKKIFVN